MHSHVSAQEYIARIYTTSGMRENVHGSLGVDSIFFVLVIPVPSLRKPLEDLPRLSVIS
jgi:hypothetical protein